MKKTRSAKRRRNFTNLVRDVTLSKCNVAIIATLQAMPARTIDDKIVIMLSRGELENKLLMALMAIKED